MAIPQYDAAGDLLAWKLEHTAQQVDDTIDGLNDKAEQTALEAEQAARQQADQTLQVNIEAEATARTAADNELKSALNNLSDDVNEICTLFKRENIFNKNALTTGYYYTQTGTGGGGSQNAYAILPVLKLDANMPYSTSERAMRNAFTFIADSPTGNRVQLSSISNPAISVISGTYVALNNYVPETDKYLFITVGTSDDINSFMFVNDSSLPQEYSAYGVIYRIDISGIINNYLRKNQGSENVGKVLIVDTDGDVKPAEYLTDVEDIYFESYHTQYLDRNLLEYGYFTASGNNIVNHPNTTDYKNCVVSGLRSGTYYFKGVKPEFTFAKTENEIVSFTNESGSITISDSFDLYLTASSAFYDVVMFTDYINFPRNYVFGKYDIELLGNAFKADVRNKIYVKKDGTGDFTKLTDAIEYAQKNKNVTIYIGSGLYDIIEELGGSEYTENVASTDGRAGLKLGNGMHLIFSSNAKVISHYTGNNRYMCGLYSPFNNMAENTDGFIIENMVLECSRCRYGIHDETSGYSKWYRNEYKNCHIVIDNSENEYWNARQCIGGGLGQNAEIIVDGCYFESVPKASETSGTGIVSYHNTTGTSSSDNYRSNIVIKNSYFANQDTVKVSYLGQQTEKSTCLVSGCSLGSAPYVQDEATGSAVNMVLITAANEIRN